MLNFGYDFFGYFPLILLKHLIFSIFCSFVLVWFFVCLFSLQAWIIEILEILAAALCSFFHNAFASWYFNKLNELRLSKECKIQRLIKAMLWSIRYHPSWSSHRNSKWNCLFCAVLSIYEFLPNKYLPAISILKLCFWIRYESLLSCNICKCSTCFRKERKPTNVASSTSGKQKI